MSYYASSNAGSPWTLEGLLTPADGSATTERGDASQCSPCLQDPPEELVRDKQIYLGIPIGPGGLRSPKSASLAAVGGQFVDGQQTDQMVFSGLSWQDSSLESSAGVPLDAMVSSYNIAQIFDQFSGPGQLKRRRDSNYQPGRASSSRRLSHEAPLMSKGWSNGSTSTTNTGYSGGRKGPLTEEQRRNARSVREMGACWRCHSLKAKCDRRIPQCSECESRKSCISWLRGCERTQLVELLVVFLPDFLVGHHRTESLQLYLTECAMLPIPGNVNARLTYGFGPPFEVPMYEIFTSCGTSLMWRYNDQRMKHELYKEDSVPLAIANDVREGIPDLVDSHTTFVLEQCLDQFPRFYYDEVGMNKLQADLLGLICNYYECTRRKSVQLRRALKLLLLTVIMGQTMYLTEDSRIELEPELQSWSNSPEFTYHMPRIAQRQFKHMVHRMVSDTMRDVLEDLHNLLWKMKKNEWATTFCVLVLLGITAEDLQISTMLVASSAQVIEDYGRASDFEMAQECVRAVDETGFGLPLSLFEKAYGRFNPLIGPFTEKTAKSLEDDDAIKLIRGVRELIQREGIPRMSHTGYYSLWGFC
ncbi:MAG: hypothetical protein M1840_005587 [Geoglossum simile]|nr:MAG: hypothetical protein M1840_005587 [Geoglossum simile]